MHALIRGTLAAGDRSHGAEGFSVSINLRRLSTAALAAATVAATGCQAPARREPVLSAFAMTDIRFKESTHWGASFTPPDTFDQPDAAGNYPLAQQLRQRYTEYRAAKDPSLRRQLRDQIAYTILTLCKHYHDGTTDDVYELTATISSAFDLFSMSMGTLGAVTGSSSDKAVYSALAALGVGTRSSLSKNILAEQTAQAILLQMEALRLKQELSIRQSLEGQDDARYPLHEALTDLFDYYTSGSVKDAIAELGKAAQQAKDDARDKIQQIKSPAPKGGSQ